jgi:hypothetical protein
MLPAAPLPETALEVGGLLALARRGLLGVIDGGLLLSPDLATTGMRNRREEAIQRVASGRTIVDKNVR